MKKLTTEETESVKEIVTDDECICLFKGKQVMVLIPVDHPKKTQWIKQGWKEISNTEGLKRIKDINDQD